MNVKNILIKFGIIKPKKYITFKIYDSVSSELRYPTEYLLRDKDEDCIKDDKKL